MEFPFGEKNASNLQDIPAGIFQSGTGPEVREKINPRELIYKALSPLFYGAQNKI